MFVAEKLTRNIDEYRQIVSICRQDFLIPDHFVERPKGERGNLLRLLRNGDEIPWENQATIGVLPTHQRFRAGDPLLAHMHFWLILQEHLAIRDRRRHLARQGLPVEGRGTHR